MPPGAAPTATTARFVEANEVAIRVGASAEGACYALTDLTGGHDFDSHDLKGWVKALTDWVADPSAQPGNPRWVDRLWNSCAVMHDLSGGTGTIHFIRHATPKSDRYRVRHDAAGDGLTFAKSNHATETLPEARPINMTGHNVQWLYDEVFKELRRLAGG
jgi:hypothetical protein